MTGEAPRLRPMTEADLSAVSEMEQRCFSVPWSIVSLHYALKDSGVLCLLAESGDGLLLGYGIGRLLFEDFEILNLAVDLPYRRQGVGRRLLTALLRTAAESGCQRALLEARVSNLPALSLYASLGFLPAGRRKNYYRKPTEDALVLCAPLGKTDSPS